MNLQGSAGLEALCPSQLLHREADTWVSGHHRLHRAGRLKEDKPWDSWLPLQGPDSDPFLDTQKSPLFPCPWPDNVYLVLCLFKLISPCLFQIPDSSPHSLCFSNLICYSPTQFPSSFLANPNLSFPDKSLAPWYLSSLSKSSPFISLFVFNQCHIHWWSHLRFSLPPQTPINLLIPKILFHKEQQQAPPLTKAVPVVNLHYFSAVIFDPLSPLVL